MKRLLSLLLVAVMLIGMMPMTALANDYDVTIKVDTANTDAVDYTALERGQVLKIPVNITSNDGVSAFVLEAVYDANVFETIDGTDLFTIEDDNVDNTKIYAGCTAGQAIVFNAGANVRTTTGVFSNINLKVKDNAPAGTYSISLKVAEPAASNFLYYDSASNSQVAITPTLIAGTVTIAGAVGADTLSFTNGAQSWTADSYSDLVSIMTSGTGLTAPDSTGYYFAGFFSGLTADGTYITEENGYYILSANAIGNASAKEFANVTEWRPRYDSITEETTGEYHALWLYNDTNAALAASLRVMDAGGITVSVMINDDNDLLPTQAVEMLNADFAAVGDAGYVKLVTNITLDGSVSADYIHVDMNGRTISNTTTSTSLTNNTKFSMVSSYGDGAMVSAATHINLKSTATVIRDVDLAINDTTQNVSAIKFNASVTLDLLENCDITCENAGPYALQLGASNTIGEISNCTFNCSTVFYFAAATETVVKNIHDCTFTGSSAAVEGQHLIWTMMSSGGALDITFGDNNKLTTHLSSLIYDNTYNDTDNHTITIRFTEGAVTDDTADYIYSAASDGTPFPESERITYVLPAGYQMVQENGAVTFKEVTTVTWYDVGADGVASFLQTDDLSEITSLTAPSVSKAQNYCTTYTFLGWSTSLVTPGEDMSAVELYDLNVMPTGTIELYAVWKVVELAPYFNISFTYNSIAYSQNVMSITQAEAYAYSIVQKSAANLYKNIPDVKLTVLNDGATFEKALGETYKLTTTTALTIDLNGKSVLLGTSNKYGFLYETSPTITSKTYTVISSNGTATVSNESGRTYNCLTYLGRLAECVTTLNMSNITVKMETAVSGSNFANYLFVCHGPNAKNIGTVNLNLSNVAVDAPNSGLVYLNQTAAADSYTRTTNIVLTGCAVSCSGTLIAGQNTTGEVVTFKMDAASKMKNSDSTVPTTSFCSITCTDTTLTALNAWSDGWYSFGEEPAVPSIGDTPITDQTVIEVETESSVEVSDADILTQLEKLIVIGTAATLEFSDGALDSIASLVDGKLSINIDKYNSNSSTAVGGVSLTVTDSSNGSVEFSGNVEVRIPFTPAVGKSASDYRVYYVPASGEREAIETVIAGDSTNGYYATFTTGHFSDYEVDLVATDGYIAGLNSTTTDVYTNGDVVVNVGVSYADDTLTGFHAAEIIVAFPNDLLSLVVDNLVALKNNGTLDYKTVVNGTTTTLTIEVIGDLKTFASNNFILNFTAVAEGTATVTLTSAAFAHGDYVHYSDAKGDLQVATIYPESVDISIDVESVKVTLPTDTSVDGNKETDKYKDYSFTVTQDQYYDYVVKATINGSEYILTGVAGADSVYTYTIDGEKVVADITITVEKTAKKFDVSFTDADGNTTTTTDGAQYNEPYSFDLPTKDQWQYTFAITIGEDAYTGATVSGTTVTIPGSAITDDIKIVITGEQTEFNVSYDGTDATITDSDDEGTSFQKGETVTITINPAEGYTYSVSAVKTGTTESVTLTGPTEDSNGNLVYTIENLSCDVTITVNKTLQGNVAVYTYLTLNADTTNSNSKTMFLVTYTGDLAEGYVPYYGTESNPMLWSDKYNAYCWLVIVNDATLSAEDAKNAVGVKSGTKADVNYSMDINGTGKIDAADAQFVYNMYTAKYSDFSTVGIAMFLAADQNGDALTASGGAITVADATAIVSAILAGTAK